jgi:hypothetical protein
VFGWCGEVEMTADELLASSDGRAHTEVLDLYDPKTCAPITAEMLMTELVDELVLMIEPITLGGGKTLFPNDGKMRRFELTSAKTAATGVQVCRYQPTH